MSQTIKILTLAIISSSLFFSLAQSIRAENESVVDDVYLEALGLIKGRGDHFEFNNPEFPNFKLNSSQDISIRVDFSPGIIFLESELDTTIQSVQITISGLQSLATYYKYEDGYHNLTEITADENGQLAYLQDLSANHIVFIQANKSTKFISADGGDCNLIGVWHADSRTCTLDKDLSETIQIDANDITLDGSGFTITGPTTPGSVGILISGKTNVTLKNIKFVNFSRAIFVFNSQNITISNNSFLNSSDAILLSNSHNNELGGNFFGVTSTLSFRGYLGIGLSESDNNLIANSNFIMNASKSGSGIRQGIVSIYGDNNEYVNNLFEDHSETVQFYDSTNNIFRNGVIKKSKRSGITILRNATSNQVYNNSFIQNALPFANFYSSTQLNVPLPYGGNYWDFYDTPTEGCNDVDNNSICDLPKTGFINDKDLFPWKIPDGWLSVPPTSARDPVIIIPGITGSYLFKDYGNGEEIWPNVTKLITSITDEFLNDLALNGDGTENSLFPMKVGDIIREEAGAHVFDGLISDLTAGGYVEGEDLFVFPYDWRKGNAGNANKLKSKIDEILGSTEAEKVDVIAHSMGGILAKQYVATEGSDNIDQLIFLGTPHLGAPKSFKALMYGDNMGYGFEVLNTKISVLNTQIMKSISQNMPAVYELLPSQEYVNKTGGYVINAFDKDNPFTLDYLQTKDKMIQEGRNPAMFPFAENIHSSLDDQHLSGVEVHNFAGCGGKTVGEITLKQKLSWVQSHFELTEDFDLKYVNGDETVPLVSADDTPDATMHYVKGISHGTLPSASGVKESIVAILSGEELPGSPNVLPSSVGCSVSGKNVSVHSPVELHIYDGAGNHTGPNVNGDIEINIPGVAYDVIGGEKFAFLPDGENYRIETKAITTGGYDLIIKDQNESDEIGAIYEWNLVPLDTALAKGEITIGPDYPAESYDLKIDGNGDGVFEEVISANEEVSIQDYLFILRGIVLSLNIDSTTKNLLTVKIDKVEKELDKGKYDQMAEKLAKLGEKLDAYKGKFSTLLTQEKNDLVNSINLLLDELI